ncbi:MAG: efflux RND transporter periplasmic adaptor subunit, partial [Planctomycetota bacterium]
RQTVFHLPDMNQMQVQLDVHESLINKLKVGQRAIVRVDSFPDHKFNGKVKKIADLARSDGNTEAKKYTAIVVIYSFPKELKLKPGMTAEVEIHIRTLDSVMAIPVQSVTQIAGEEFVYVKNGDRFYRTPVTVSEGNESFLIAEEGLEEGNILAMDAYQRGLNDIESEGLGDAIESDYDFEVDEIIEDESPTDSEEDDVEALPEGTKAEVSGPVKISKDIEKVQGNDESPSESTEELKDAGGLPLESQPSKNPGDDE